MGEITIQNKQQNYTESRIKHRKEQTIRRKKTTVKTEILLKKYLRKKIITLPASFIVHHQLSSTCNFWYSRSAH